MMNYIKGPDFPGGGIIMGRSGIRKYFETGSGSVCVRGKYQITEKNGRTSIVFTELPYMVNKKNWLRKLWIWSIIRQLKVLQVSTIIPLIKLEQISKSI